MKDSEIGQKTVNGYGYGTIDNIIDKKRDVIITSLPQVTDELMLGLKNQTDLLVCLDDSKRKQFFADIVIRGSIVPKLRECDPGCGSKFLLGKDYMVLDKQFQDYHELNKVVCPEVKSILVAMGGSDINNFTITVMDALERLDISGVKKKVVVGPAFNDVNRLIKRKGFQFEYDVSNMAELMFEADIIIAGGGMTLYELACVGTPGIVLCQTDYQMMEAKCFDKEGVIINLGDKKNVSAELIASQTNSLMDNYGKRKRMSKFGKGLINGEAIDNIVEVIQKVLEN